MKNIVITIIVSALVALGVVALAGKQGETHKETAYERVLRTGTLRCGYALYDPWLVKDPNSGALHGIFYDLINEMGKELDLKIDWIAEVGYGEIEEGFQANKYDAFCNGVIPTPKRAKFSMITTPVVYNGLVAWVKANDHRFDNNLDRLNAPDITLVVRDGDVNESVTRASFPKAKTISSPQLADFTQMLVDVQTGKADAVFFEKSFGDKFLIKNPGSIRSPAPDTPVYVYPVGMMLPPNEPQLKNMIDATLLKLIMNGTVKNAILKNAGPDYKYWPVSLPYETRHP